MMRDDTESKDHVLESILRMRRDANDVNSAFKSINDELLRIIHNVKRHPDFVSKVGKLQKEWEEHYNTFKETLWRSREIAGSAQALIADFVDVYLPLLLNSTVADETKAKELEVYVKMADSNVQATDVTRSFAELTSAVQLCAYRWRELQIKAKKYTKSDRIAEKFDMIRESLGVFVPTSDSFVGKGVIAIISFLMPSFHIESSGSAPPGQDNAAQDQPVADTEKLISKLTAICHLWSAIQTDLQLASNQLGFVRVSTTPQFRSIRLENLEPSYRTLAHALHEYQVAVE